MRASDAHPTADDFTAALSEWMTSLFPDSTQQASVLPVKKAGGSRARRTGR